MAGIISDFVDMVRRGLGALVGGSTSPDAPGGGPRASHEAAWEFVERVMGRRHFTPQAREWLRANINLRVDDLTSTNGGGYWMPHTREVRLFTAQDEAAVHELAHAWWHDRRIGREDEMIEATARLSAETRHEYATMARLAHGYMHGIPEQGFEGFLSTRNDWEMFASLASGSMGDMRLMPPYVRKLYEGLFEQPVE